MDCIFCKIVAREIPATLLYEDELAVVFPDINPHAPTHFLVVPKEHIPSVARAEEVHEAQLGHLFTVARKVAREEGLEGYKVLFNVEKSGGQEVMHVHMHVLGGAELSMPKPVQGTW